MSNNGLKVGDAVVVTEEAYWAIPLNSLGKIVAVGVGEDDKCLYEVSFPYRDKTWPFYGNEIALA